MVVREQGLEKCENHDHDVTQYEKLNPNIGLHKKKGRRLKFASAKGLDWGFKRSLNWDYVMRTGFLLYIPESLNLRGMTTPPKASTATPTCKKAHMASPHSRSIPELNIYRTRAQNPLAHVEKVRTYSHRPSPSLRCFHHLDDLAPARRHYENLRRAPAPLLAEERVVVDKVVGYT